MKPDKHLAGEFGIILTAIGLIVLTWVGTMRAIHVQRLENLTRINAILTNQALTLTEQINRQLLALDQTRALHHRDGSFAGVISADYRIAAMTDIFRQTDLGTGGFVTLVSLEDGRIRGTVGPVTVDPAVSIADTRMFAAIQRGSSGLWIGPTATDPVMRIAKTRIRGRVRRCAARLCLVAASARQGPGHTGRGPGQT